MRSHVRLSRFLRVATVTCALLGADTADARQKSQSAPPPLPEAAEEAEGLVAEPRELERAVIFLDRHLGGSNRGEGWFVDFGNMIPGAGWLAIGPGYRQWYADDHVLVEGSAAISTRGYKTAHATLELPRLLRSRLELGAQYRWQDFTQVKYFGEGPDTAESELSRFRLQSHNLVGYATVRPRQWLGIGGRIGWVEPSISESVFGAPEQPTFVHSEASITADTRDFPGHATQGSVARAAVSHFSDRDLDAFSFTRYEAEAAHFQPFADRRVVLALRGWLVTSDTAEGHSVPFYLQPSLGGPKSLRGYSDYRFHDRNMLLFTAETRIALMRHVDAAVFVDAGNVGPRVADLDLGKRSYGAGVRLHSRRETFARFDVARGEEGWRFLFRLTDPLNLSRLTRRTAPVPFVP